MPLLMPQATKALLLLAFACALILRTQFLLLGERGQSLPRLVGTTQTIEGVVAQDPDVRETSVRIIIDSPHGRLLAVLPPSTHVAFNDHIKVEGRLESPHSFNTDTGRVFDYRGYLRAQGVLVLMPKAQLISHADGPPSLRGALFSLKHAFSRSVERLLPAQDAALLEGIVLGERRGLPKAVEEAFIIASLIHVVVLSGFNISIIAEGVLRALKRLPRSATYSIGIILMFLFVVMTGGGPTSLRALIMALIAILARYLRRPAAAMRSLLAAAAGLVLVNPLWVADTSFLLSITATFGLIALGSWVDHLLLRVPILKSAPLGVRSVAASTIAVQIFVLPILLYFTGVLSFVSLPANILTLPFIPIAMLMGFVGGVLGFIHPLLGLGPALLSDLVLRWLMFVAQTAADLPLSHAIVPPFSAWVVWAAYMPLTYLALRIYKKSATIRIGTSAE